MITKIHTIVDGLENPVEFLLSAGHDSDCTHAVQLLKKVNLEGSTVLGDWAYGTEEIRAYLSEHGPAMLFHQKATL